MSKVRGRRRIAQETLPPKAALPPQTLLERVHGFLARLPRLVRVLLAGILALGLATAIFPFVDYIYLAYFLTPETRVIPSLVTAGIGLAMYLAGWWLMVGTSGDKPEMQVQQRPALLVYLLFGFAMLTWSIVLVIQGFSMTDMVAG